jgi:antitoxin ParD1/3/4
MPNRNIVLTEHQSSLVDMLVDSGRYQNASEVLREGLRLIEVREAQDAAKLSALKAAARMGTDAFERGAYNEFSDAKAMTAHLDKVASQLPAAR